MSPLILFRPYVAVQQGSLFPDSYDSFWLNGSRANNSMVETVDSVITATESSVVLSATAAVPRYATVGESSYYKGYTLGGFKLAPTVGYESTIESLGFVSKTTSLTSASVVTPTYAATVISSEAAIYLGASSDTGVSLSKFNTVAESSSSIAATLAAARPNAAGVSCTTHGYFLGGYSSVEVDGLTFSTETSLNPSSVLASVRQDSASCYSPSSGFAIGSSTASKTSASKIEFATSTITTPTLAVSGGSQQVGASTPLAAYVSGGFNAAAAYTKVVSKLRFITSVYSSLGLSISEFHPAGSSSFAPKVRAYTGKWSWFVGVSSEMIRISYPTDTASLDLRLADTAEVNAASGTASTTKGFIAGHYDGAYTAGDKIQSLGIAQNTRQLESALLPSKNSHRASASDADLGYGFWFCGLRSGAKGNIDKLQFSSMTGVTAGVLVGSNLRYSLAVCQYKAGGSVSLVGGSANGTTFLGTVFNYNLTTHVSVADSVGISPRHSAAGLFSDTNGYVLSGRATTTTMATGWSKINHSTRSKTQSTVGIDLTYSSGSTSSSTHGHVYAGLDSTNSLVSSLQSFNFSTETKITSAVSFSPTGTTCSIYADA